MMIKAALLVILVTLVVSAALTALARKLAPRIGLVAVPRSDRYHEHIVPMGGGLAIFTTLALAMLGALLLSSGKLAMLEPWLQRAGLEISDLARHRPELWVLLGCSGTLFALGLWDDMRGLGPLKKLIVQLGVAFTAAYFADMRVELFIPYRFLTALLSACWITLIMNAFNFLDNMDGASAGIATIVTAILLTAAVASGQILVGGLALVLIGTLLGFLIFNFPPAKIFMGDAGSLLMGFLVAILSLRTTYYHETKSGDMYAIFIPLIALSVPLYDFVSVTTLRLLQGKSPLVGDTQHFSHRLKRRGLSDTQTILTLYLATLCTGLGATFLYQVNHIGAWLIILQTILVLVIIAILEANNSQDAKET
ncbi:glycosyltransferase family 4 protein [Planctomycetota bacterium]